jgi:hypothetical protein
VTCPFYVASRPSCALGEPDGRHCGPRQYPQSPCNLDEIGRGEAWRSIEGWITRPFVDVDPVSLSWVRYGVLSDMPAPPGLFAAVGWLP